MLDDWRRLSNDGSLFQVCLYSSPSILRQLVISGFQKVSKDIFEQNRSSLNILKDKDFEKSRKVLAAKHKSLIHEHGKGNKPKAATALEDEE